MTALRTTVIGSYPFPGWLEHAAAHLADFGPDDVAELQEDAVIAAVHDQVAAGLDTISDGEQTRLDFNLGFYGFLEGIEQGERRAGSARPPTTSARSTGSSASSRPRAASARSRSSSGCGGSRRRGRR